MARTALKATTLSSRSLAVLAVLLGLVAAGLVGGATPAAAVELRSGSGNVYRALLVVPAGARVLAGIKRKNGYAPVTLDGTVGWVVVRRLAAVGGDPVGIGAAVVTVDLNLRAGFSGSHDVLRAMPVGSRVQTTDTSANGYRNVIRDGLVGWAFDAHRGPIGPR